ncbi:MAG: fibronectin/fibrinogen-binding protein [Oscillospiraceae bacterium]|nr:fibronectin/fibrinogen-binding protein [Oscillospiraceae bacterium]
MSLDALCLTAVVCELQATVVGAKIDKIFQPARDEVILALRGERENVRLLLSAGPGRARLQLTALPRENPAEPPMFCMLLRKHLTGGRIVALSQTPHERIATLEIEAANELGDKVSRRLVLEVMGRTANLILVDGEGRVIDCLRRVEGDLATGKRQVLPGLYYRLPEPRVGLSPLISRELEFRGDERAPETAALELEEDVKAGNYTPTLLKRDGQPVDFSFMPILQYGLNSENIAYERFSDLFDDFYRQREQEERVRQRGRDLLKAVRSAHDRVARKLGLQRQELADTENRERLRELGDILTSNLHLLKKGQSSVLLQDYYNADGKAVDIKLDPLLTPQQNAARYYKNYNRAKTASVVLKEQLKKGERELSYLESVLENLQLAEGERDLQEIRQELTETGYLRRPSKAAKRAKPTAGKPMEFRSTAGLRISVGKNNSQNDRLTTKLADKRDIWLHTQKIHGSHVILWTEGQTPDTQSITEAAMLAAWFSQGRDGQKVPVDYTPVKFVKKPAGARPGMVVYTTYETAYVTPEQALVDKLRVK